MTRRKKYSIKPVQRGDIKGIDREILGKTVDNGVYPLAMAKEIRIDRIQPDPSQPRKTIDPNGLEELAASIREQGILQPLVVALCGEQRIIIRLQTVQQGLLSSAGREGEKQDR